MNRFEKMLNLQNEATLEYGGGEFRIIVHGDFVRCAVTETPIALEDLRYWSVDLQEAYLTADISLKRYMDVRNAQDS